MQTLDNVETLPESPSNSSIAWSTNFTVYAKKSISLMFLLVAALSYTFSAMPSTVNFYRSVVPPLSTEHVKHQNSNIEKATVTTTEFLNVSQVFAVPSLLFILEFISINLAIEYWRKPLDGSASNVPVLILFLCCQLYPFTSVVYQVADKERHEQNQIKSETTSAEKDRASSLMSSISLYQKELTDIRKQSITLSRMRQVGSIPQELADRRARIKTLETIISQKEQTKDAIEYKNSVRVDNKTSSAIEYWRNNMSSNNMLTAYSFAGLFPLIMLSLGKVTVRHGWYRN